MEDHKFYVTPNRILDPEIVGDVEYFPKGSPGPGPVMGETGLDEYPPRKKSELWIRFKNQNAEAIYLTGDEADTAWQNYREAAGSMSNRVAALMERQGSALFAKS